MGGGGGVALDTKKSKGRPPIPPPLCPSSGPAGPSDHGRTAPGGVACEINHQLVVPIRGAVRVRRHCDGAAGRGRDFLSDVIRKGDSEGRTRQSIVQKGKLTGGKLGGG